MAPYVKTALEWALFVVNGFGSIALHFASKYFEAIRDSHPWSLYQAAKDKDIVRVKVRALVRRLAFSSASNLRSLAINSVTARSGIPLESCCCCHWYSAPTVQTAPDGPANSRNAPSESPILGALA